MVAVTGTTKQYTIDNWYSFFNTSGSTNGTITQVVDSPNSQTRFAVKVQRNASATNTSGLFFGQAVETQLVRLFAGQQMKLIFWAKAGANYSPTSSLLSVNITSGTGTNEDPSGAYSGNNALYSQTVTLTTSWQLFSATVIVPSSATELKVFFRANHTGTAGADDSFYLAQTMFVSAPYSGVYLFMGGTPEREVQSTRRYLVGYGGNSVIFGNGSSTSGTNANMLLVTPTPMRTTPTLTSVGTLNLLDNGGTARLVSAITLNTYNQNYAKFTCTSSSLGTGTPCLFSGGSADQQILLSAEI